MIFQSFNLLPTFTALENVALPLEFLQVGWRTAEGRARTVLERVGLSEKAQGRRPADLSGGEQQRVAIARALVTEPALLLADEPTGNLDSATGASILSLLEELNDEGATIALITHDHAIAARLPRKVEMLDGRIVSDTEGGLS